MVRRTAARVVIVAVGTTCVGVIGALVGVARLDVTLAVVLRSVLVVALLLALTQAFRLRDRKAADHPGRSPHQVLTVAALAYALNLSSWDGRTLFGQMLVPAGVGSVLIDLVVWMLVAAGGVWLGDRATVQATAAPVPYA